MLAAMATVGLDWIRKSVAGSVRSLIGGGGDGPTLDLAPFREPLGDPGLFGPDSVAWRVGADAAMLIGGVRALLLQTVHPLAMAGVGDHSNYRSDPWGRLQRTAMYVSTTTFGSTAAAHEMVEMVTAVHQSVKGTADDGRPYSALDPELLRWVHVTEIDSFAVAVEAFGSTTLSSADIDQYHLEMSHLGTLMGAVDVPENAKAVADYYQGIAPELCGSTRAREAVRFLLWPPVPARLRPAYLGIVGAAVSLLPDEVRDELWLPKLPFTEDLLIGPGAAALSRLLGWALGESPLVATAHARATSGKNGGPRRVD